jgi:succinate-semialdehyde dehydrogenase / glutarate-semialdehyde dehydrogenase
MSDAPHIQQVRNPRTGLTDYQFPIPAVTEIATACGQLRNNQKVWMDAGIEHRIAALLQWKAVVEEHKAALIEALCADTGRQWETVLEAGLVATSVDRWCGIAREFFNPQEAKTSSIPFIKLQQSLVAYGLVGVISPWNFPLLLSLIDSIPALLAGCAVVVKPSEVTPRFIEVIQKTIAAVPALEKVFRYMAGDGGTGAALVNNCDLICFTGSTATGKKVYAAAAERMIPVFLELGGKDPAIVLEGANLPLAAASILWGSTANAGQSCLSIERVYAQKTIFDEFVSLLAANAQVQKIAYPNMDSGSIAPIIFEKQVHIINEHLKDALDKGARIVCGAPQCEAHGGGFYLPPTVLVNVNHTMRVMQEETFGPVIPVMAFKTKAAAIALANDTVYGLSGAVFAATTEEAMETGAFITGGAISINDCALTAVMHEGEKNSFKMSGIGGTRMGPSAMKRFMRQKVFIVKDKEMRSPWWYGI